MRKDADNTTKSASQDVGTYSRLEDLQYRRNIWPICRVNEVSRRICTYDNLITDSFLVSSTSKR